MLVQVHSCEKKMLGLLFSRTKIEQMVFAYRLRIKGRHTIQNSPLLKNKRVRDNSRRIVTLSAIFSFRKGLIIAKMPLKILGSLIMLTALILIGNPSCKLEQKQNSHSQSISLCVLCAQVKIFTLQSRQNSTGRTQEPLL